MATKRNASAPTDAAPKRTKRAKVAPLATAQVAAPAAPPAAPPAALVNGRPVTLGRYCAALRAIVPGADAILARRGGANGWGLLARYGLASARALLSGPEASAFVLRALLATDDAAPDAARALARARAWCDAETRAASAPDYPSDALRGSALLDRVAHYATAPRRGAHPDSAVRYVLGTCYVLSAPGRLPAWVMDAPVPDALRLPGSDAALAALEARAASAPSA